MDQYSSFINEIEKEWSVQPISESIETRYESYRNCWVITHNQTQNEIIIVEHETGLEFLLGIGVELAATAIVMLLTWAWNRWRKKRTTQEIKPEPSLVFERVTEKKPDGTSRTTERLEFRGPLDSEEVRPLIAGEIQKLLKAKANQA